MSGDNLSRKAVVIGFMRSGDDNSSCKSVAELFGRFFSLSRFFFTDLSMLAKTKWPKSEEKMDFGGR